MRKETKNDQSLDSLCKTDLGLQMISRSDTLRGRFTVMSVAPGDKDAFSYDSEIVGAGMRRRGGRKGADAAGDLCLMMMFMECTKPCHSTAGCFEMAGQGFDETGYTSPHIH